MKCPNCGFFYDTKKKARSNAENSYFHAVVLPVISAHTGYSTAEVKDILKSMFLKREFYLKTKDGMKEVKVVGNSSKLSTLEFEKFMADIRIWASCELGLFIPEPNQNIK